MVLILEKATSRSRSEEYDAAQSSQTTDQAPGLLLLTAVSKRLSHRKDRERDEPVSHHVTSAAAGKTV